MSDPIACFFIRSTTEVRRFLRRFAWSKDREACPLPFGYHNARVPLDSIEVPAHEPVHVNDGAGEVDQDDPRWPAACACGYRFTDRDERQVFGERVFERVVDPERMTLAEAPPGAMYDAEVESCRGVDGVSLMVKVPPGDWWLVDGPSSGGGPGWTRTGDIPTVTATPSIKTPHFHGWLREGKIIE